MIGLFPCFPALNNLFEFKHHCYEFGVLNRSEDPVQRNEALRIGFISTLAYLEHVLCLYLFGNQKLIQLLVQLLHVILKDSVAFEALLVGVIFEL